MMEFRDWLAGGAAAVMLGVTPAIAQQAPRSLFEAMPAAASANVTTDLRQPAPSLRPSVAPVPPTRPSVLARASVEPPATAAAAKTAIGPQTEAASAEASAPASQARILPPTKPAFLRQRLASADPVPEVPAAPAPAAPFSLFAPPQPAVTEAPAAPAKPMTRAEKRRAEREARKQAVLQPADPAAAAQPTSPTFATNPIATLFGAVPAQNRGEALPPLAGRGQIDQLVAHHARLNHVPEALVHRIIVRESRYNPRAVGRGGAMGLMQIKTATARGVGYAGGPAGLLDAETNLTYGVKYLAGAWRVAGGSHDRAVSHYARGYYYAAKRQGRGGRGEPETTAVAPAQTPSFLSLFTPTASAQ